MAISSPYSRPYLDSAVFISWLKDVDMGRLADGTHGDRHPISAQVLQNAEGQLYRVVTSYFTFAEVYKKKSDGNPPLTDEQNGRIVKYFESSWIDWVPVERLVGEEANSLLIRFRNEGLRPADAVHLACALRAKCDVLLTWDGPLLKVKHSSIRIEYPDTYIHPPKSATLWEATDGEA